MARRRETSASGVLEQIIALAVVVYRPINPINVLLLSHSCTADHKTLCPVWVRSAPAGWERMSHSFREERLHSQTEAAASHLSNSCCLRICVFFYLLFFADRPISPESNMRGEFERVFQESLVITFPSLFRGVRRRVWLSEGNPPSPLCLLLTTARVKTFLPAGWCVSLNAESA